MFIRSTNEPVTHSAFTIRARFHSDKALPLFYAYYFRSHAVRQVLTALGNGTNINNLNQGILNDLSIPLPSLPEQERIVSILSAYDDLIENNTRRIEILEDMARSIYREWFVNFRFPGHEKVKMVDSELGPIPEGWEIGRLDNALVLQRGFDLPVNERREGTIPIYAANGIVGTHCEAKVKAPGVVTGRSGSLGIVNYVYEDFWPLNTVLWVKEFRRATPLYGYYLLSDLRLENYSSGVAVPTLNRNNVHGLPVVLPSYNVLQAFDDMVLPIFSLVRYLEIKNETLRGARDLLLPELISGELAVSELAEIDSQAEV